MGLLVLQHCCIKAAHKHQTAYLPPNAVVVAAVGPVAVRAAASTADASVLIGSLVVLPVPCGCHGLGWMLGQLTKLLLLWETASWRDSG